MESGSRAADGPLDERAIIRESEWRHITAEAGLTPRQLSVIRHVFLGNTIDETADLLGLHRGTVKGHLRAVYRKLGVNSRAKLVLALVGLRPRNTK